MSLYQTKPIIRDDFLEKRLNRIILTRGKIVSIDKSKRYKRRYRIVVTDLEARGLKLNVKYYVFIDNKESYSFLSKNSIFEFNGQFMAFTPLNSKRDSYIFDIVLEKGAIIIE